MPLTDSKVKNAKPKEKEYKLADAHGLYLLVKPNGGKYWRLKYRFGRKEKKLSIGVYPSISLKAARKQQAQAKLSLVEGRDPSESKRMIKVQSSFNQSNTFSSVAAEWFRIKQVGRSQTHRVRTKGILLNHLEPLLAARPIVEISAPELLFTLRKIEEKGAVETAHRARQIFGQIARFSIASGIAERDVSSDLKGALSEPVRGHFAAITDVSGARSLMQAIDVYKGSPEVTSALKLSPLLLARPGELRHMEWSEIDFHNGLWEIPARKMKLRSDHIVPLPSQALSILADLLPFSGRGTYVFPSARGPARPLSENAVRVALRSMGFTNEQMTPHGFRAMGRTMLDEVLGYRVDWIEMQLAHAVRDSNGRAYNRTKYLEQRKAMLQHWADYLQELSKDDVKK